MMVESLVSFLVSLGRAFVSTVRPEMKKFDVYTHLGVHRCGHYASYRFH